MFHESWRQCCMWLAAALTSSRTAKQEDTHITPIINASTLVVAPALCMSRVCTLHKTALPSVLFLVLNPCRSCCPTPPLLITSSSHKPPLSQILMEVIAAVTRMGMMSRSVLNAAVTSQDSLLWVWHKLYQTCSFQEMRLVFLSLVTLDF